MIVYAVFQHAGQNVVERLHGVYRHRKNAETAAARLRAQLSEDKSLKKVPYVSVLKKSVKDRV